LFFLFSSPANPHYQRFSALLLAFAPKSLSDVAHELMFQTANLSAEDP